MNGNPSKLVRNLIDQTLHGSEILDALRRFASEFGWRPSDELDRYSGTESFSNGHLVVEHGFDRTAVISFLRCDTPYSDLAVTDRRALLELSYNNMVDWHLLPEQSGMRVVFNRTDPPQDQFFPATSTDDVWRADAFDRLTEKRPSPNVKTLDDALIDTVSFWKRAIQSDLGNAVSLPQISAMINSVILIRALEDYTNRLQRSDNQLLTSVLNTLPQGQINAYDVFNMALSHLGQTSLPEWMRRILGELRVYDSWDTQSLREMLRDFYISKYSRYRYNFHLISKHALSRIYEHYVSLLRDSSSPQLTLFQSLPEEVRNKDLGSVYTPQYIARFFARYLREHRTPRAFRSLITMDPACGSGMFLRTLLEMQCNPVDDGFSREMVQCAFSNTHGIDIDENACQATRLSLALLHLVLTGEFPDKVNIEAREAIERLQAAPDEQFDLVIANPPFVRWDGLTASIRERLSSYMLETGLGKQDLYLAFLKLAIEHTNPGGILCFVLPHSFLLSQSALELRRQIGNEFSIRMLGDLSEVPVFEQIGSYVVLLVAERTADRRTPAMVVKCREFVGAALQDALNGRTKTGPGYDVFEVDQLAFKRERWHILRPEEELVRSAIETHPKLDTFVEIRQGLVTGCDNIFIRPSRNCPKSEREIWIPLLPDREMVRFGVPDRQSTAVFMPFGSNGERLEESALRKRYPETWEYLMGSKALLSKRPVVLKSSHPWWAPERPRSPGKMLVPKIVTPHLVLLPRFGLDEDGKYAISRGPYLVPRSNSEGISLLKVICAAMNSAVGHWQLASSSHKYSRGYLMLEVKTLKDFRMPDPASLVPRITRRIVRLVDKLIECPEDQKAIVELDVVVGEAFGLSEDQLAVVGVGG